MLRSPITILLVILAVGLVAWWLRRAAAGGDATSTPNPLPPAPESPEADPDDDEYEAAVTADGHVLIPFGRTVRVVPIAEPGDEELREDIEAGLVALGGRERTQLASVRGGVTLQTGDITAARVRAGGSGEGGWRLETLGRDGDYAFMPFASQEGARQALKLIEQAGIVRRPLDEDGRPIPHAADDFAEARRRYDETEQDLVLGRDPDEPGPAADWSSRR